MPRKWLSLGDMTADYAFTPIEEKWKKIWEESSLYAVSADPNRPKYYVLDMFPYPSGKGLHVGHPLGYVASDLYARFKRMQGYQVLHPMGYDAFGLPAEQYALETGQHPAVTTEQSIAMFRSQLDKLGFSYDWSRSVKTCDPDYYRWTQWIFIQLFQHWYNPLTKKAEPLQTLHQLLSQYGLQPDAPYFRDGMQTVSADTWKAYAEKDKELLLSHFRLAYQQEAEVNWCPVLGTVLANDEVKDGRSERGGHPVIRKKMRQWFLRITAYADRLLEDLDGLNWSAAMKDMQRHWIGKSQGAELTWGLEKPTEERQGITVFTTRPDTLFGVSFLVLAPEHEAVRQLTTAEQQLTVEQYLQYVNSRSDVDRQQEKKITGAFTGAFALHPFTAAKIPIWISEYVLPGYGTGAIMAVPDDDERDRKFAEHFQLSIPQIMDKSGIADAQIGDKRGVLIHSDFLNDLTVPDAIALMLEKLQQKGIGKARTQYRLRDAGFSRQRYWGEPIPIVYRNLDGVEIPFALKEDELPLLLPEVNSYKPTGDGKAPLANNEAWMQHPDGIRETDTMPGYAGSSWYYLRYMDPQNREAPVSAEAVQYWKDVDLYIGGSEHAVGHLLYARFWHKFLFDLGIVPTPEPFRRLVNQGMIGGRSSLVYRIKDSNTFVSAGLQQQYDCSPIHVDIKLVKNDQLDIAGFRQWREEYATAEFILEEGKYLCGYAFEKMSKRYHNVTNPDDVVAEYGADCLRTFLMFLGPLDMSKPWDPKSIDGVAKFLRKVWRLFYDESGKWKVTETAASPEALKTLHKTIQKVQDDIERLSVNTAVSAMMIAVNELTAMQCTSKSILTDLIKLLAPFAPFITEELYASLGHIGSIHQATFPVFDAACIKENSFVYPVSINGKTRADIAFALDASPADIQATILAHPMVQKWMEGKPLKKFILVPGRIINVVV